MPAEEMPPDEVERLAASEAPEGCSAQAQLLCIMYIRTGDLAEAAQIAGYVSRDSARVQLYKPPVARFLAHVRTMDLKLAAERLALRLDWIIDGTVFDVLEEDGHGGLKLKAFDQLTRGEMYAVRKLRVEPKVSAGEQFGYMATLELDDRIKAIQLRAQLQDVLVRWARALPEHDPESDGEGDGEKVVFEGGVPIVGRELDTEAYMLGSGVPQARERERRGEQPGGG